MLLNNNIPAAELVRVLIIFIRIFYVQANYRNYRIKVEIDFPLLNFSVWWKLNLHLWDSFSETWIFMLDMPLHSVTAFLSQEIQETADGRTNNILWWWFRREKSNETSARVATQYFPTISPLSDGAYVLREKFPSFARYFLCSNL